MQPKTAISRNFFHFKQLM